MLKMTAKVQAVTVSTKKQTGNVESVMADTTILNLH